MVKKKARGGKKSAQKKRKTTKKKVTRRPKSASTTKRTRGSKVNAVRKAKSGQNLSIVRIMGKGQYKIDSPTIAELNRIDNSIVKLIEEGDRNIYDNVEARFKKQLSEMVSLITRRGKQVDVKEIVSSDFILPPIDATIEETRALFRGEGIFPN